MKEKEPRISVRVDAALKARIEEVSEQTGIDEATLVRNCLEAICDHVDRTGRLTSPIELGCEKPSLASYPRGRAAPSYLNDAKTKKSQAVS